MRLLIVYLLLCSAAHAFSLGWHKKAEEAAPVVEYTSPQLADEFARTSVDASLVEAAVQGHFDTWKEQYDGQKGNRFFKVHHVLRSDAQVEGYMKFIELLQADWSIKVIFSWSDAKDVEYSSLKSKYHSDQSFLRLNSLLAPPPSPSVPTRFQVFVSAFNGHVQTIKDAYAQVVLVFTNNVMSVLFDRTSDVVV